VPGGYLHAATDWQDYADHILATLSSVPTLTNPQGGFAVRPATRPETKFEQRGLRLGHASWDIIFRKATPNSGGAP
jgi:tRNA (guanine-N7-)-methyltransferase